MFRVKVNRDDRLELHEQVAAEIRRAIADGEAEPGDRRPPAKDFAAVLDVDKSVTSPDSHGVRVTTSTSSLR